MIMKYIKYIFVVSVLVIAASGVPALAADMPFRGCADISAFSARVVTNISDRSAALRAARLERLNQISQHWQQQDAEKLIARESVGSNGVADFSALERSLANASDEDKLAIEKFKTALETASGERRLAVDVANTNFRSRVRILLQNHSEDFNSAAREFARSEQNSLAGAAAWCAAGASQEDIQLDIRSKLQSARDSFQGNPKSGTAMAANLRALTAQYKADIHVATEDFKTKVTAAQAEFKAAIQN
jgi:hypothetical protein